MIFTGVCKDLANDGKGLVEYDNTIVLVDNLLPGEKAEIEIYKKLSKCSYGKVKKYITTSSKRVEPMCPYYDQCGGCQLMHLKTKEQLIFKQNQIKQAFKRIANLDLYVADPISSNNFGYRNKIEMPVQSGKIGFYKNGTNHLIPITNCKLVDSKTNDLIRRISRIIKEQNPPIKNVVLRRSFKLDQTMLILVSEEKNFEGKEHLCKKIIEQISEITTIVQNVNNNKFVTLSNNSIVLYGPGYIEDEILNTRFLVSASSFYQVNAYQTEGLYSEALELAKIRKTDVVLDAYCGVGTIGIIASKYAKKVYGVEINAEAIKDAKKNSKINKISNIKFICKDAKKFIKREANDANILIIDPPRAGCDKEFLDKVIEKRFKKIIYISCDYQTLARDIKILNPYYEIKKVQPVDMFPNTYHVETIVLLTLREIVKD